MSTASTASTALLCHYAARFHPLMCEAHADGVVSLGAGLNHYWLAGWTCERYRSSYLLLCRRPSSLFEVALQEEEGEEDDDDDDKGRFQ